MKIALLASGSSGNFSFVSGGGTRVLVDAGTCCLSVRNALSAIGEDAAALDAVCLTHDHGDHVKALAALERKYPGLPLYATDGTIEAVCCVCGDGTQDWNWTSIAPGEPFDVGALRFEPFSVPHDAADPVGFVISDGAARFGLATDIGSVPAHVRLALRDCDVLALEFNHDPEMLRMSARPWSLKQRICGRSGHLSNSDAADLLSEVAGPRLKAVFPVHVSAECNAPHLAVRAARAALEKAGLDPDLVREPAYPAPVLEI